ncbi:MAG: proteasome accessory factor PafA2 family protein [Fimbriimonadaceae bacterium]|nr:proteasome accessory factor PafA2 family protein [Fimbriimonadaceae bacterium]QYK58212.1 MAG: proteasome accessory factor PafA2 family protein [Fimbriimonadaceae bacterium]
MSGWIAGIETEYGLAVDGRGPEDQVEDATAFVRSFPGPAFLGWDSRHEFPRADLRGFTVERLSTDPIDAAFDAGRSHGSISDIRSDRVLTNGARLYNDHGHPEYATPECLSIQELVLHDLAGETVLMECAREFEKTYGRRATVYKNNSDGHGASYGTHESYLAPRALGFETLMRTVLPVLVARTLLCGAGKVGSEAGPWCDYQLSQRADFLVESANVETLYRRPVLNTRDEPHSSGQDWIRLHVISGDANRIAAVTGLKVGLVKLALALAAEGRCPTWSLTDAPRSFAHVSRTLDGDARIETSGGSWTTARHVLADLCESACRHLGPGELQDTAHLAAEQLDLFASDRDKFAERCDWAAKLKLLDQYREVTGAGWRDPGLKACDLGYHNIDPAESLFDPLVGAGMIEAQPDPSFVAMRRTAVFEPTRARARSLAVSQFAADLETVSWGVLVFKHEGSATQVRLAPEKSYPESLAQAKSVESYIERLEALT